MNVYVTRDEAEAMVVALSEKLAELRATNDFGHMYSIMYLELIVGKSKKSFKLD